MSQPSSSLSLSIFLPENELSQHSSTTPGNTWLYVKDIHCHWNENTTSRTTLSKSNCSIHCAYSGTCPLVPYHCTNILLISPSPYFSFLHSNFLFFPGCVRYADVLLEIHSLLMLHALHRRLDRFPAVSGLLQFLCTGSVMTFVMYILQNSVKQPTRADVVQSERSANRRPAWMDVNSDVRAGRQWNAKQPEQKTHIYLQHLLIDCI